MRFSRREQPPADVVALLGKDERIVSWADTDDGRVVAVTPLGLWWPDDDGDRRGDTGGYRRGDTGGYRRIGWELVVKAVWRDGWLVVIEGEVVDDTLLVDRPPVAVRIEVPRDLPPTVRKRVEGNIVERELVTVPDGAVRFVARRCPGRDGVVWWGHLEDGTPDTAATRRAVAARLEILRAR